MSSVPKKTYLFYIKPLVYKSVFFFITAVLRKLFEIRFSYNICNFSRICLLVKMASKTVTRSTDRTTHEVYISFQISQRVFFFCLNYSRTMKETVFSFKLFKRYIDCFSFLHVRTDLYGGKQFLRRDMCTVHYIKYDLPTSLTATRCPRSPRLRK